MPYISEEQQTVVAMYGPQTPGQLNYQLSITLIKYIQDKGLSYQTINDILGALEGAKLEFYRRFASPYEDTKARENGDIWK